MDDNLVNNFARLNGYDSAKYLCDWNGYSCYEPIFSNNELSYVGLPLLILVSSNGEIRMSTPEEAMQQIDDFNND